jgi:hypothetical protein
MFTCLPNFTHSFIIICEIIKFKVDEKVFFLVPVGDNRVLEAQKQLFQVSMDGASFYSCS